MIPDCEKAFVEIMETEAPDSEKKYETKLTLLEGDYLTIEDGGECGGVIMYTKSKKIVCTNTLKSRLDLCFEELLPHIRNQLFPKKKEG